MRDDVRDYVKPGDLFFVRMIDEPYDGYGMTKYILKRYKRHDHDVEAAVWFQDDPPGKVGVPMIVLHVDDENFYVLDHRGTNSGRIISIDVKRETFQKHLIEGRFTL